MPVPSIALLCDLDEPFHPDVTTDRGAWIYETVRALSASARSVGGMEIHVVVRRGARVDVPAITVDPAELGTAERGAAEASPDGHEAAELRAFRRARQEAVYVQLALRGMLQPYALVHVLSPVVGVMQIVAASGCPVVQTIVTEAGDPSAALPTKLLGSLLRRAVPDRESSQTVRYALPGEGLFTDSVERSNAAPRDVGAGEHQKAVPIPIDLGRFRIGACTNGDAEPPGSDADRSESYVLAVGPGSEACRIAEALGRSLRRLGGADGRSNVESRDAAALVAGASLLVYTRESSPASLVWPLRALACGVPVAGWTEGPLDLWHEHPDLAALAEAGDVKGLVRRVEALPFGSQAAEERRAYVMAHHGPRAVAARYRGLYASLLEPDAPATAAAGLEARDELPSELPS